MTEASPRTLLIDLRAAGAPAGREQGPLAIVCGLPVLVRNLLVLARAGYGLAVLVVAPADRAAVERALAPHRQRVRLELTIVESEAPLLAAAQSQLRPESELLLWPAALSFGRFAPALATAEVAPEGALVAGAGPAEGLALLGARAAAEALARGETAEALLARLAEAGAARPAPEEVRPAFLHADRASRDAAERALLVSLRKPVDGAVAQFDRYVSLFLSRRLMRLPVTPNQVTVVAGLIGIGCGVIASLGGYLPMLIAALGFQLNSILDGIDGEIARAKLHESRLGQWLDTWADDSSNLAFMVGACVGCYRTWGWTGYLALGAVTAFGLVVTAVLMYHYVITVAHSGDLNDFKMPWEERAALVPEGAPRGGLSAVLARLKFIVRRDTFVFLTTIFALAGQLRVMTWFYAAGASSVWIAILVYRVLLPAARRRAA
jgi:phosphatidylglycerophosphate synthase